MAEARMTRARSDRTVTIIKWLFFGMIASFLAAGISLQIQQSTDDEPAPDDRILDLSDGRPREEKLGIREQFQAGLAKLASPSPQERIRGIQIVMAADPAAGPAYVQPLMADGDPLVRAQAVSALVTFGTKDLGAALVTLLNDPDPQVRATALGALPQYATEAGLVFQLGTALSSPTPAVVLDAISAWRILAPSDPAGSSNAIMVALSSYDEQVLTAALGAISSIYRKRDLAPFVGALQSIQARLPGRPAALEAARLEKEAAS
jgi:HEAT repeat protein